MAQLILRALNAPGLLFLSLIAIAFQTSLFQTWPLHYFQPDVVLLLVVWCALKRGFVSGGMITLIMGHFTELHSSSPQGLFLISYMSIYLLVRGFAKLLIIEGLSAFVLVVLFSSTFFKFADLTLLYMLGAAGRHWRSTLIYWVPGSVVNAAASYWVFQWLEKFDLITFRKNEGERELDPEFQLGT